jgi:PKD repeat protein
MHVKNSMKCSSIAAILLLLALVMLSIMAIAKTVDIAPQYSNQETVSLYKGKAVDWTWTAQEHALDFEIKDPEGDVYYQSSARSTDTGNFVTTITGDWVFAWHNDNPAGESPDYTVTLDYWINTTNEAPTANIGVDATSGVVPLAVSLTGTGVDTDGFIVSYKWDLGDGTTSIQESLTHTFNQPGTYTVGLTVTDNEGTEGQTEIIITADPVDPTITSSSPADGASDLGLDTEVLLEFSLAMDKSDLEGKVSISPTVGMTFYWSEGDRKVSISFADGLAFATMYTLALERAYATNGGQLAQPLTISFTTKDAPTVSITSPISGAKYAKGDSITVSGTSTGIAEGEEVTVRLIGDSLKKARVGSDGSWSVDFTASKSGTQTISVEYDVASTDIDVTVNKSEDTDGGISLVTGAVIAIVIVMVLVLLFFLLGRRKKTPGLDD